MKKVIVLGSINIDLVMETERLPHIGETILGQSIDYYMGGKGANQAVACSRMDCEVILYGSVGNDTFGEKAINHLKSEKINIDYIKKEKNIFTGTASIFRIKTDNSIVVLPGANMLLEDIKELTELIEREDVFITQLEIPIETVHKGLKLANESGALTILNPAPFNKEILKFIDYVDIITPNETEFQGMVNSAIHEENFEQEMIKWSDQHRTKLIVTRGSRGVSYVEMGEVITVPAKNVDVVDTTGAGDTFNGILSAQLLKKASLHDAVKLASIGASISTTTPGAQSGMPKYSDIHQSDNHTK